MAYTSDVPDATERTTTMTTTAPRSEIVTHLPNQDGNGISLRWTRVIAGVLHSFTKVVMPDGELRFSVSRYTGAPDSHVKFGHEWKPTHFLVIKRQPLAWSRPRAGHYIAGKAEVVRDPNASPDNRWSARYPGTPNTAHRLLKSAQAAAAKRAARAEFDALHAAAQPPAPRLDPVEAITAYFRSTHFWPNADRLARNGVDRAELDAAVAAGRVLHDPAEEWYQLPVPNIETPLAVGDVVTVDPQRKGRQFDVIALDEIDREMIRVAPRNPAHLDDNARWVSLRYTSRVPAAIVEPYEDVVGDCIEPAHFRDEPAMHVGRHGSGIDPHPADQCDVHRLLEQMPAEAATAEPAPTPTITVQRSGKLDAGDLRVAVCSAGDYTSAPTREADARKRGEAHLHDRHGVEPRGTVADLIMPAMPEQYRRALAHLLAPYGFAAPTGVDTLVPSDANPEAFLVHDPSGLAIGAYDEYLRLSYPAVHAGEGDGDVGTAWFDLAYGTSFETVVDIAAGLAQRLYTPPALVDATGLGLIDRIDEPSGASVGMYRDVHAAPIAWAATLRKTDRSPYVGEGADGARRSAEIDLTEADTHPTGSERWHQLRASADRWIEQAERIEASGGGA